MKVLLDKERRNSGLSSTPAEKRLAVSVWSWTRLGYLHFEIVDTLEFKEVDDFAVLKVLDPAATGVNVNLMSITHQLSDR